MVVLLSLALACSDVQTGADSASSTTKDSGSTGGTTDTTTDTGTTGSTTDTAPIALASCDTPIGGVAFGNPSPVDFNPNFDNELAAIDLDALPETIDISGLVSIYKGVLTYTLGLHPDSIESVSREELRQTEVGTAVLGALALGLDNPLGVDFDFLRQALFRYYTCTKAFPLDLDGFNTAIYDTSTLVTTEVDSIAKCGPRALGADDDAGVYIAETVIDGTVRETEIMMTKSRADGQIDFAVYDADGKLTDRSQFPTVSGGEHVVGAAPYVCMSCHFDLDNTSSGLVYDVLIPAFGPCQ